MDRLRFAARLPGIKAGMNSADDPFDLNRFVSAQASVYGRALGELRGGSKRSHWMWFVFPQLDGLGFSPTAETYAIKSRDEASAYLRHPVLGARLIECAQAVLAVEGRTASDIFGYPDDLKLHSCATLFADAAKQLPNPSLVFDQIIAKYFDGQPDAASVEILQRLDKRAARETG